MAKREIQTNELKNRHQKPTPINRVKSYDSFGTAPPSPSLSINRSAYNVSQFNQEFIPIPTTVDEKYERFRPDVSGRAWLRRIRSLLPITLWLPEYNIRQNLLADILVGITIAIFQVPQSMGYCLIAHVPPVYGLYSSFFPALFYTIFGTGMHCAFGPFALVSGVMTGDIVIQVMEELGKKMSEEQSLPTTILTTTTTTIGPAIDDKFPGLQTIDIAIMVAFIIGCYIAAFGIFRQGYLSSFMSEELISGFTCSASVLVFVSQIRYLLGVDLGHFSGPFNLIWTLKDVFTRLAEVNTVTLALSGVSLAVLLTFKLGVNRLTAHYGIKTPFPIELLVVICGTLVSHQFDLTNKYGVKIVGEIGSNFPAPLLPRMELWPIMWQKCIATAIVGYTITFSVCKIYGKKHGYPTDPTQEMLAMGATNIISSFFQCIPSAASLPRSALQETAGGKTQVVSLVNCCCIVVVILALGRYLEELPTCVLGSCIAVALVSLISKIGDFIRFWKVSKLDGCIWLVTFFGVLVISIDLGIYIGIVCSLLLLIYKSSRPKTYLLGTIDGLDIYVPINKFNKVLEPPGFKIFQMCGPLNFSNVVYFSGELEDKCEINVTSLKKFMNTKEYRQNVEKVDKSSDHTLSPMALTRQALNERIPKYLIIDCSMFSFIDYSGISTLKKTILSFEEIGIKTVLSGVHVHLESMFAKEGFFDEIPSEHLYKSVHDAVVSLQELDHLFSGTDHVLKDLNDEHIYMKDITSQMDSNQNTFKSDSIGSPKSVSLRDEPTPDYGRQSLTLPRIYTMSGTYESPAYMSNCSQPLSISSPAIYQPDPQDDELDRIEQDSQEDNMVSTSFMSSSQPNLETSGESRDPADDDLAISNDLYYLPPDYNQDEATPPILHNDSIVPPPPPPPPPAPTYTKNNLRKPVSKNKVNNTPNGIVDKEQANEIKDNKRISASLKERSAMVEKLLESHKMSDA